MNSEQREAKNGFKKNLNRICGKRSKEIREDKEMPTKRGENKIFCNSKECNEILWQKKVKKRDKKVALTEVESI